MARFRFRALDAQGREHRGVLESADQRAAVEHVRARGQLLLDLRPDALGGALRGLLTINLGRSAALKPARLVGVTRELAVLLGAGQSLDQALRFLVQSAGNGRERALVAAIRERVRGGSSLSAAMSAEGSFGRLYLGLVRAGEAGGQLADALGALAQLLERQRALEAKVQSALIYPVLLLLAAIGTIVLMLTYVLPQFTPIFLEAGATLPTSTQLLIDLGQVLSKYGLAAAMMFLVMVLVLAIGLRQPGFRLAVDRLLLRVPPAGEVIRLSEGSRLVRTLGTLLTNGVGLLAALATTRDVLRNRVAVGDLERAIRAVREGGRLADELATSPAVPARILHLLRLGEETGRLGEMALRAAEIHEIELQQLLERLVALIVPVITLVMGVVVAGIVASLLLAMLSLNELAA